MSLQKVFDNISGLILCLGSLAIFILFLVARIRQRRWYNADNPITIGGYPSKGIRFRDPNKPLVILTVTLWVVMVTAIYLLLKYA